MDLLKEVKEKLSTSFKEEEDAFRRLVFNYLAPPKDLVSRTELLFRSTLIVGPMNYGKTSFIEAKLGEVIKSLLESGVDEYEIGYVYAQETPIDKIVDSMEDLDFSRLKYLFVFSDDAAAAPGQHGRTAVSEENVSISQFYIMLRHRIKERYGYRYYIHVIHSSQVYTLVDVTFRRCAALKLFKDVSDEPNDLKVLARMLGSAAMHALREISFKIASARDLTTYLEGIYSAIAYFKGIKRLVKAFRDRERIEEEVKELKTYLRRVQYLTPREGEGEASRETNTEKQVGTDGALRVLGRLLIELRKTNNLKLLGNRVVIKLNNHKITVQTRYIPQWILEEIRSIRPRRTNVRA